MTKDWIQTLTIIGSVLIPMLGGYALIFEKMGSLDHRLTVIETVMVMEGKLPKQQSLACEGKDAVD